MGGVSSFSNIMNKIFIIITMMPMFFLIIAAEASLDDYYYFKVQKVSGKDDNEQNEALIVEKFRVLLGLKSFKSAAKWPLSHGHHHDSEKFSPSPSPGPSFESESPSPTPATLHPIHPHAHQHPPPRFNPIPHHKTQKDSEDKGRIRRVLLPVLVSTGGVFVLVSVLVLIWVCFKRKHHKKSSRKMSVFGKKRRIKGRSKYVSSQRSTSKVNLNPSIDLFYLNSLGMDLEQQQSSCLNNALNENATTSSKNQEVIKLESDHASSSSSTREITTVHEDTADSVKYEYDDGGGGNHLSGDEIIPCEIGCHHSSDDESFHSFNDSHSSTNFRLSNASAASLNETQGNLSPNSAAKMPYSTNLQNGTHKTQENLKVPSSPACHKNFEASPAPSPPTPPPPPPLPPFASFSRAKLVSKATCSSTLRNLSSSRNSDSSADTNQTPQSVLLSPQETLSPLPTLPSIPPPPCPPPILKQNKSPLKGPPPPPSPLPQHSPLGKDGVPLPKLKPLHWDKVRAQPDRSMVWDKLRSSSFELDEEMIESLFGYNLQNSMKNDESKSKTPSPSKHVLEPKRLQNITILSKALNVTAEQVCDALMKGGGLSLQQLETLVKMVPTKEEETKLSSYKGDINELGSAEKLVKAMLTVPLAFQRAEVMLFRETFEDEVVHLRNSFSMLEEACKELRSSRLFLKLLEAVLKTGNRMNVGTIRGGAKAFKLDALLKLADVKGTDGKTTLLHFVVQEIIRSEGMRVSDSIMGKINQRNKTKTVEEREEDYRRMGLDLVSGLSTEVYNVKKAATIDMNVLTSSVSNLTDGMSKLKHLLDYSSIDDRTGNNFVHSMSAFMKYAERNIKELQEDERRIMLHVREITEYFHGDVSKEEANPLRIFVIVRDFLGMLDNVCKELRNLKIPNSPNPLAPFK